MVPAPAFNTFTSAGILNTTQCHQPEPVGASGSYTVTAKLLVPSGAFDHLNSGEILSPVQPKLLKTCALAITPSFNCGLVTSKSAALAKKGVAHNNADNKNFIIVYNCIIILFNYLLYEKFY